MVFPLTHSKKWFVPSLTPVPSRPFPPLKPFIPNHKPGTLPAYFKSQTSGKKAKSSY